MVDVYSNQFCKKIAGGIFLMGTIMTSNIVLILICRMEFHMGGLKKICRVCGTRLKKKAKKERERSYECKEYIKELVEVYCIDVSSDHEDIHPLLFRLSCLTVIKKWHTNRGGKVPPVFSSALFLTGVLSMRFLITSHKCSKGFRSALWDGHGRTDIPLEENHAMECLAVWQLAPSC